jgi:glycosyltransferase involved in cell wall biosynthesis
MFLIKLLLKYKKYLLVIFNLLPRAIQARVKIRYRKFFNDKLYSSLASENSDKNYINDSYAIPSNIDINNPGGINFVGFPTSESGLGQHLRSVGEVFEKANLGLLYYDCKKYFPGHYNDHSVKELIEEKLKYNTNIFVCNGDALGFICNDLGVNFFSSRYNIHYGAWELREYPKEWIPTLSFFDEYWAMSSFLQKSVSDVSKIPVLHMPYPVDFKIPTNIKRSDFNLPEDKFLYIFTFDISSLATRKNPHAVIKAFFAAFPKDDNVGLVIKISSKKEFKSHRDDINQIMELCKNDNRVYLVDEVLSRNKILGLINCCDVYVSLHRAEGFGIGMAEAMKMGKAVIATNYSGNTDFTLPFNSCLVDYKLIPIKPLEYIYEHGKVWADADIEHASFYMKKLYEDSEYCKKISKAGKSFIDNNYSVQAIMPKYISRLKILGLLK